LRLSMGGQATHQTLTPTAEAVRTEETMNQDVVSSFELRGYTVEIIRDPDPISPEDRADRHAFLVYGHRDFTVHGPNQETAEQVYRDRAEWEKTHTVYPVYAYIHSGVRLGLSTAGMVDIPWDVSLSGAALVTRDESEIPQPQEYAQAMIEEWNQYLSGDVYGYKIADAQGEDVDSCWGFYGQESCEQEARAAVPEKPSCAHRKLSVCSPIKTGVAGGKERVWLEATCNDCGEEVEIDYLPGTPHTKADPPPARPLAVCTNCKASPDLFTYDEEGSVFCTSCGAKQPITRADLSC